MTTGGVHDGAVSPAVVVRCCTVGTTAVKERECQDLLARKPKWIAFGDFTYRRSDELTVSRGDVGWRVLLGFVLGFVGCRRCVGRW